MKRAWLTGFTVGPCFAYLCWAVASRRWAHATLALALNLALWTLGPAIIAQAV